MFKYIFIVVFIYASICAAEDDKFVFSISDNTPASFFSSGIATYFFKDGSVGVFQYSGGKFYYGSERIGAISSLTNAALAIKENGGSEDLILFPDGSAGLIKNAGENYSCPWDSLQNCLYSDTIINEIDVQNLMGKTDIKKLDPSLKLKNRLIKFPIGAKIYRFGTEISAFDFNEFDDFSSLVCSKNEDDMCRSVVSDGVIDMAALFELVHGRGTLSGIMFTEIGKNDLSYVYDINAMTVTPYSASCLEKAEKNDLSAGSCSRENELGKGFISERKHKKSGIVYWVVDYKNPEIDNAIFWLNSSGEPFKAHTNPPARKTLNMYNRTAAEAIFKAMK